MLIASVMIARQRHENRRRSNRQSS